jgi:hypothetical protein
VLIEIGIAGLVLVIGSITILISVLGRGATNTNPENIPSVDEYSTNTAVAVTSTAYAATATVVAQNPDPYGGTLVASDAMSGPGSAFGWDIHNDQYGQCNFKNGAYHVVGICDSNGIMNGNASISMKFAFEIHLNAEKNCGNLHFYFNSQSISIDVDVCQDGHYDIRGNSEVNGTAAATHTGTNQYNIIGIVADGTHLTLYINYARVNSLSGVYTGIFGLKLDGFDANGNFAEVVYTDARLWSL